MYLTNSWYVAAWDHEVGKDLFPVKMLGEQIVLYRKTNGEVAALEDACPHRKLPLSMGRIKGDTVDLTGRMLSNGQPHRALPLTVSLCMAVAARIEGSLVHAVTRLVTDTDAPIRIAMPSGILVVGATVQKINGAWHAEQGAFFRTQRRMFDGFVYVRASRVPGLVAARGGKLRAA